MQAWLIRAVTRPGRIWGEGAGWGGEVALWLFSFSLICEGPTVPSSLGLLVQVFDVPSAPRPGLLAQINRPFLVWKLGGARRRR